MGVPASALSLRITADLQVGQLDLRKLRARLHTSNTFSGFRSQWAARLRVQVIKRLESLIRVKSLVTRARWTIHWEPGRVLVNKSGSRIGPPAHLPGTQGRPLPASTSGRPIYALRETGSASNRRQTRRARWTRVGPTWLRESLECLDSLAGKSCRGRAPVAWLRAVQSLFRPPRPALSSRPVFVVFCTSPCSRLVAT